MATSNTRRETRLVIEAETKGEDSVARLADRLRKLAESGDDMAPALAEAADQLDRLAGQERTVRNLQALEQALAGVAEKQKTAAGAAADAAGDLVRLTEAADAARAAHADAKGAFDTFNAALTRNKDALKDIRAAGRGANETTAEYRARLSDARVAIREAERELAPFAQGLSRAADAAKQASAAQAKMEGQYAQLAQQAGAITESFAEQQRVYARTAADAANLGIAVDDLAGASQRLVAEQADVIASVRAQARAMDDLDAQASQAAASIADRAARAQQAYDAEQAALAEVVAQQRRASAEALRYVEALDAEAAAAERVAAEHRQMRAEFDATAARAQRLQDIMAAFADADEAAAAQERAAKSALDYVEALDAQAAAASRVNAEHAEMRAQFAASQAHADRVRDITAAFEGLDNAAKEAGAAVSRALNAVEKEATDVKAAFGDLGIRSLRAVEAEIQRVQASSALLQQRFKAGAIGADDLARAVSAAQVRLKTLMTEMNTMPALPGVFERMNSSLMGLINRFGALSAAIGTVAIAARPVVESVIALDQMRRVLTTVTGRAAEAGRQIDFVRDVAQRAGQSFNEVGQSYAKFSASALQAGLSTKQVQEAFAAVTMAAGNMGLSTEQAKRALEALSQMASKGVVGMEELRQQLGDALPGVLPALARELGLTQRQLAKVVESGNLLSNEAIPAIGRALKSLGPASGEVDGLVASWNRLKNVFSETAALLADGGFGTAAAAALKVLAGAAQGAALVVAGAGEAFTLLAKTIGISMSAIANRTPWEEFKTNLKEAADESDANMKRLTDRIGGVSQATDGAAAGTERMGSAARGAAEGAERMGSAARAAAPAMERTGTAAAAAAEGTETLATAAPAAAAGVTAVGAAAAGAAPAVAATGKAVDETARSFGQLVYRIAEQDEAVAKAADTAGSYAETQKKLNDAFVQTVALAGDDVNTKVQQAAATRRTLEATNQHVAAEQRYLDQLRKSRAALAEHLALQKKSAEEIKESLKTHDEKIRKQELETEKVKAAADATRAKADADEVAAATARDNANSVEYLSGRVKETADRVVELRAQMVAGKVSSKEYEQATREAAKAVALLRDGLEDAQKALGRRIELIKADGEITKANNAVRLEQYRTMEAEGRLAGDIAKQREGAIRQREVELEQKRQDVAESKKIEQLRLNEAIQEKEQRQRLGEWSGATKEAIELRIKKAQAMLKQAAAQDEVIRRTEREIELSRRQQSMATEATSLSSGFEQEKRDREAKIAKNRLQGATYDSDGWATDGKGNRITGSSYTPPPDDSGDYRWEPNLGRPGGGNWVLTDAAQKKRAKEDAEAQERVVKAYKDRGYAAGAGGFSMLGLPADVRALLESQGYDARGRATGKGAAPPPAPHTALSPDARERYEANKTPEAFAQYAQEELFKRRGMDSEELRAAAKAAGYEGVLDDILRRVREALGSQTPESLQPVTINIGSKSARVDVPASQVGGLVDVLRALEESGRRGG